MEEKIIVKELPKSPVLAAVLSIFFPFGVGALYNREYIKGLIYLIIFAGLVSMQEHGGAQPFAGIILAGFYFFQIFDSVHTANAINRRALKEEGEKVEEEKLVQVAKTGSIFWGIVLIALGAILLLANFEVLSYESVVDFWPVLVIVIGLKLVFDYFARKAR